LATLREQHGDSRDISLEDLSQFGDSGPRPSILDTQHLGSRQSNVNDSDTDVGIEDAKAHKRTRDKPRRKRTTNLGPRLKVLNINTIESGLKVECQMETAKQKTITFEFSTVDFVPEDISNEFVKEDLLPQQHRDILIEQLNDIVRQLKEDATKIPIVHFPPEQASSSSPNRDTGSGTGTGSGGTGSGSNKKPTGLPASETGSQDQLSAPSSPAKSVPPAAQDCPAAATAAVASTGNESAQPEVRKFSRFTIIPSAEPAKCEPSEQPQQPQAQQAPQPPVNYQPTGATPKGNTPVKGLTPDSTIHQGQQTATSRPDASFEALKQKLESVHIKA